MRCDADSVLVLSAESVFCWLLDLSPCSPGGAPRLSGLTDLEWIIRGARLDCLPARSWPRHHTASPHPSAAQPASSRPARGSSATPVPPSSPLLSPPALFRPISCRKISGGLSVGPGRGGAWRGVATPLHPYVRTVSYAFGIHYATCRRKNRRLILIQNPSCEDVKLYYRVSSPSSGDTFTL